MKLVQNIAQGICFKDYGNYSKDHGADFIDHGFISNIFSTFERLNPAGTPFVFLTPQEHYSQAKKFGMIIQNNIIEKPKSMLKITK